MAFANRLAIIAGGLGGIARATGNRLLAESASLALLHHPLETSERDAMLESSFTAPQREHIETYACDITDSDAVATTFESISEGLRSRLPAARSFPSILINSAGYVSLQALQDVGPADALRNLNVNIMGPLLTSQAFVRMYSKARDAAEADGESRAPGGRIVNLSSQAGHVALPLHGAYCASKAGLMGLTRVMALEWAKMGITSNTVSPTVVWTALARKAWADEAVREAFQNKIPTNRFAEPDEIASAIEYLCRDSAAMINGADIRVDGGFTIV